MVCIVTCMLIDEEIRFLVTVIQPYLKKPQGFSIERCSFHINYTYFMLYLMILSYIVFIYNPELVYLV